MNCDDHCAYDGLRAVVRENEANCLPNALECTAPPKPPPLRGRCFIRVAFVGAKLRGLMIAIDLCKTTWALARVIVARRFWET